MKEFGWGCGASASGGHCNTAPVGLGVGDGRFSAMADHNSSPATLQSGGSRLVSWLLWSASLVGLGLGCSIGPWGS